MYDRVDSQLPDQLADDGKTRVGMDEIHLLQRAYRVGDVAAEEEWDLRSEPSRDLCAQGIGHARDQYALGSHRLPNLSEWTSSRIYSGRRRLFSHDSERQMGSAEDPCLRALRDRYP